LLAALCLMLLAGAPRVAAAQPPPLPADTMIVRPTFGEPGPPPVAAPGDTASVRTFGARAHHAVPAATAPVSRWQQPGWVMMRSLVVPGWGQANNGAWVKAGVIGGIETALIIGIAQNQADLRRLDGVIADAGTDEEKNSAILEYNAVLEQSNQRAWWLGGVVVYSMIDAYVDAHFRRFKVEFETDPALPGGKPPAGRLGLRWDF